MKLHFFSSLAEKPRKAIQITLSALVLFLVSSTDVQNSTDTLPNSAEFSLLKQLRTFLDLSVFESPIQTYFYY
jgi:hypothetical protein